MIASWRAELLALRKSKVVWALVSVAPLLVLVQYYGFTFIEYLRSSPATASYLGTPAQQLAPMLPSQFVIATVEQFETTAPFILLGAVIAGADWGRGTISTAMLQGPGRTRSFAGQVLAVMTAAAVSVLTTFALAGVASEVISIYAGPAGRLAATPAPPSSALFEAVGAGLLIGFAYTALGIALGTLCRSAAGAVAAALAWYTLVEQFLYNLSVDAGVWVQRVYDAFPGASEITLTSMFGSAGGGATSATYQPVSPWASAAILSGYTAVFLTISLLVIRRRDISAPAGRRPWRARRLVGRPEPATDASVAAVTGGRAVIASLRAELTVMAHWPAMWAFVLISPVFTFLWAYAAQYLTYLYSAGSITSSSPGQVLPGMLPGQLVPVVLNTVGYLGLPPGEVAFFLIGALAGGSQWAGGTLKTALLQGPGRVSASAGQALAIGVALLTSVLLTFAIAGVASIAIALAVTGHISPAASPLPRAASLFAAVGIVTIIGLAWAAVGWTAATILKSAAGAFAVILLWTTIVQLQLDQFATELTGPLRVLYDLLPEAATNTLSYLYGQVGNGGSPAAFGEVAPPLAIAILAIYVVFCVALPIGLTRIRDVVG